MSENQLAYSGDSRTRFSVANTDFEDGDDDHGYGDCIFLVIYAQPSHMQMRAPGSGCGARACVHKQVIGLEWHETGLSKRECV
jgi:hypothetical protein